MACNHKYIAAYILLLSASFLAAQTAGAEYFPGAGKTIHIDISPPYYPTDNSQCDRYSEEITAAINEVSAAHDDCLKSARTVPHRGDCTKADCEDLHDTRDSLHEERRENLTQCSSAVKAYNIIKNGTYSSSESTSGSNTKGGKGSKLKDIKKAYADRKEFEERCKNIGDLLEREECYQSIREGTGETIEKDSVEGDQAEGGNDGWSQTW